MRPPGGAILFSIETRSQTQEAQGWGSAYLYLSPHMYVRMESGTVLAAAHFYQHEIQTVNSGISFLILGLGLISKEPFLGTTLSLWDLWIQV